MQIESKKMETILIAGGSGMIGKALTKMWRNKGHRVRILTRGESDPHNGLYHWDVAKKSFDKAALEEVTVIVNLAGAGISDKRWTEKRKKELLSSRVGTTNFLYEVAGKLKSLEQFISASGMNCYGYDEPKRKHQETDPFGNDTLSVIVEKWEEAAEKFAATCTVTKVRTSMVLAKDDGALKTIARPIKFYVGSPMGTGKQITPWIHLRDLTGIYNFLMENRIGGVYNANGGNSTNKELTKDLAETLGKPIWLPNIPAKLLMLLLGEMSSIVLETLQGDNSLIKEKGYHFRYEKLDRALNDLYKKEDKK